jgi:NMD protein affecting ribosome stability and mRNA decay
MPQKVTVYYEGILQVRNPSKEVIDFVRKKSSEDNKTNIVAEIKEKNGVDLYFDSQRYLQTLGKKLKKKFAGELKVSPKLKTESKITSKKVYRVTVLFRVYNAQPGDVIGDFRILAFDKKFRVKNTRTGKQEWLTNEQVKRL